MERHKVCYNKLHMMYSFAAAALRSEIDLFPMVYTKEEKENYIKQMEEELGKLLITIPRNCLYKDHWGTCRIFCDCGCPDGMKQCTSQGD